MREAFLILLAILLPISTLASNPEGNALVEMKRSLLDPKGALNSWDVNLINPCTWLYVTCDSKQQVITVTLEKQNLSGWMSPAIGNLSNLQNLRLRGNSISSSIPPELGRLQSLLNLDMSGNKLTGSIPDSLRNLTSLRTLYVCPCVLYDLFFLLCRLLNNNTISGTIPPGITLISSLQVLDLSFNNLSGRIPSRGSISDFNLVGNPELCGSKGGIPCPEATLRARRVKGRNDGVIGGLIAAGVLLLLLLLVVVVILWRRRSRPKEVFFDIAPENDPQASYGQLRKFTIRELQVATDSFGERNVLGQGGFGKVYKGVLSNGSTVAVKRLSADHNSPVGGEQAFQTEVEMIGMAVHQNILRLQGYCITPSERILVYPYMPNGSVASCLQDSTGVKTLDWRTRKRIALGAAQGLRYLHEHCNPRIIHRDVKAANVLLDSEFQAVVGDFGLAKLIDPRNTHITTNVRGTPGHIAPEYLSTGKSSEKTDVFGYGIMLLELITGKRAFDLTRLFENDDVMLLDWVKKIQLEGGLSEIVDGNLKQEYDPQQVEELIQVALLCTQVLPGDRPTMAEVVSMLEGDGLAEKWEEWKKMEVTRRQEMRVAPHNQLEQWMLNANSTSGQEAIELSGGR